MVVARYLTRGPSSAYFAFSFLPGWPGLDRGNLSGSQVLRESVAGLSHKLKAHTVGTKTERPEYNMRPTLSFVSPD